MTDIHEKMGKVLRDLGVNHTDRGFLYTMLAMRLIWETEENLHPVYKKIYDVIARRENCHARAVESAIRKLARKTWEYDKGFFLSYDASLLTAPSNVVFLEILLRNLYDLKESEYE